MHYMTKKYWSEEPFHSSHTWTPPKYNSTKIWSIDYFFVHFFGRWNNIIYNQWLFIAIATDPRIFWSAAGLLIWEIFLWAEKFGEGEGACVLRSWRGYVGQALVFMWNSAMRESFNFYFSAVFCLCRGIFGMGGGAGAGL